MNCDKPFCYSNGMTPELWLVRRQEYFHESREVFVGDLFLDPNTGFLKQKRGGL